MFWSEVMNRSNSFSARRINSPLAIPPQPHYWAVLQVCPTSNLCIGQGTHSSRRILMPLATAKQIQNIPGCGGPSQALPKESTLQTPQANNCFPDTQTTFSQERVCHGTPACRPKCPGRL